VVVVVDQDHIQRVLASFGDSKLRFWTTQVIVNRFPGSLRPNIEVPAEGGEEQGQTGQNKSVTKGRLGGDREMGMGMGMFPGGKMGRGGYGGPPPGMMNMMKGRGSIGPTQGRPPAGGFGPPGGYGGPPSGLDSGAVGGEDSDRNVELVIYGIISLYERYPPRPNADSAPPTPKN
jgi:hypothetical protein